MRITPLRFAATFLFAGSTLLTLQMPAGAQQMQWTRFELPSSGVSLRIPLAVFEPLETDPAAQGRLFVSRDNQAQLLLSAFENDDGRSVADHRKIVTDSKYAYAEIDYAPLRKQWFVLSGEMDRRTFYHRVTFSCGGRLINSWAMLYPTTQKPFYDSLIERMHASFRAGRGAGGDSRFQPATN